MSVSTDYRDNRKAAYQQYSVVSDFNACKLPDTLSAVQAAPLGVAFAAAALSLGICIGMDFFSPTGGPRGPDLLRTMSGLYQGRLWRKTLERNVSMGYERMREQRRGIGSRFGVVRNRALFIWFLSNTFRLIGHWLMRSPISEVRRIESHCHHRRRTERGADVKTWRRLISRQI